MLILSRKPGQKITLTNNETKEKIHIQLHSIFQTKDDEFNGAIGIRAESEWKIDRSEVLTSRKQAPKFEKKTLKLKEDKSNDENKKNQEQG